MGFEDLDVLIVDLIEQFTEPASYFVQILLLSVVVCGFNDLGDFIHYSLTNLLNCLLPA